MICLSPSLLFNKALTLVMLNKLRCHAHFQFSANQITRSRLLILIPILNDKQCRSRSVGFFRSQLILIYTVCKDRVYPGSAGQGLNLKLKSSCIKFWNLKREQWHMEHETKSSFWEIVSQKLKLTNWFSQDWFQWWLLKNKVTIRPENWSQYHSRKCDSSPKNIALNEMMFLVKYDKHLTNQIVKMKKKKKSSLL